MYGYIYKTTNLINNKIYVGQKKSSVFLGEQYLGSGTILKKAIKRYGVENFIVELIEWCDTREKLNYSEKFWISELNSRDKAIGYNIAEGGEGGSKPLTLETKLKIGAKNKGHKMSDEQKEFLRKIKTGKPSPRKGVKASPESIEKMRQTKLAQHKHLSDEEKQHLSELNSGKILSKEHKNNISNSLQQGYANGTIIPAKGHSKKVINIETGEIFDSVILAQEKFGRGIYAACYDPWRTTGGYHWSYIDDNGCPINIPQEPPVFVSPNAKKVQNIETGEIFDSITAATIKYPHCIISKCCHGKSKTAGGYHWKFVD